MPGGAANADFLRNQLDTLSEFGRGRQPTGRGRFSREDVHDRGGASSSRFHR